MDIEKTTLVQCSDCEGTGETSLDNHEGECVNCLGEGTRVTLTFPEMVETLRAIRIPEIDSVGYDGEVGDIHGHAFIRFESGRSISLKRGKYTMGSAGLFEADTPLRQEPYGRQTVEGVIGLIQKSVDGERTTGPFEREYEEAERMRRNHRE
ncbi:hypothetical protein [Salinibacter ruber]|uniref:Uncharacterized protein n=1 Tax=Salinibacter ruber TaxID=146919 RepID=A0A9X2Q5B2_9BACT|nr:hypothetical protein [Salinibacter ruber]MCS3661768.1 hypothetical protein [Salinibacter ruber]MCS3711571.1 hypothetical protein [Salinibacter ruber]